MYAKPALLKEELICSMAMYVRYVFPEPATVRAKQKGSCVSLDTIIGRTKYLEV
jgi:hypothetical protein